MLEARVLVALDALLDRLAKHPARICGSDPAHGSADPVLGTLGLSIPQIDAAVYRCRNERCEWVRFEAL